MRVVDSERYRTTQTNRDLWLVFYGPETIGQVRRGIDDKWYPELPALRARSAAVHRVVLAHEAMREVERGLNR